MGVRRPITDKRHWRRGGGGRAYGMDGMGQWAGVRARTASLVIFWSCLQKATRGVSKGLGAWTNERG